MDAVLTLESVAKTYVTKQGTSGDALTSIDLSVNKGEFVSIIGIPFAWQHVKLAMLSLSPVGKTVALA